MITLQELDLAPDLEENIDFLLYKLEKLTKHQLNEVVTKKLKSHFNIHHIYHSTGIEGNRLTLQETKTVLQENITIPQKLEDSTEVQNMQKALSILDDIIADPHAKITENYLKQLHAHVVGKNTTKYMPGTYRGTGVIIEGAEHVPPEPFAVPIRMQELFEWIQANKEENLIIVAALAHHEMVSIHPFLDGNGRTGRLLLNLIIMKAYDLPFTLFNIQRKQRAGYYEALDNANKGEYEAIIHIVGESCKYALNQVSIMIEQNKTYEDWAKHLIKNNNTIK